MTSPSAWPVVTGSYALESRSKRSSSPTGSPSSPSSNSSRRFAASAVANASSPARRRRRAACGSARSSRTARPGRGRASCSAAITAFDAARAGRPAPRAPAPARSKRQRRAAVQALRVLEEHQLAAGGAGEGAHGDEQPRRTRVLSRHSPGATSRHGPPRTRRVALVRLRASQRRLDPTCSSRGSPRDQWGVVSISTSCACAGSTIEAVGVRVRDGPPAPSVPGGLRRRPRRTSPLRGLLLAAVKACGDGASLSHYAAGALCADRALGRPPPRGDRPGPRRAPTPGDPRPPHEPPADRRTSRRRHGIPVTTPARTLRRPRRRARVRAAAPRGARGPGAAASSTSPQLARRARPPAAAPRARAASAKIVATGPAPTRSELEDVVLDLSSGGGLAHPRRQRPAAIGGRRVVPGLPLAGAAAGRRGRRRRLARPPARPRGRRRAPGAARGRTASG